MKSALPALHKKWTSWFAEFKLREHSFVITVAIAIGILCGFGAVLFRFLVHALQNLFWGQSGITAAQLAEFPGWKIVLIPTLGGLLVGPIIYFFSRESRGHGVPEVMLAVNLKNGIIRPRVALMKGLASALTIASGGSAGREGPIIQMGSAIGSTLGQLLQVSRKKMRVFVACGAAGGIAATFNAPIAGALFAVEVILAEFGVAHFSPIVISSVLATVIARYYLGTGPVFTSPEYELISTVELFPYVLLGLVCGVVSLVFIKALFKAEDLFEKNKHLPLWIQPAVGGFALGLLALVIPQIMGDGHGSINLSLLNHFSGGLLFILLAGKIIATSLTLGSGGSGGVFAPSLFMGAMAGALVGQGSEAILGPLAGSPGGYALVGMGGVVAGTTHAPIAAILIIFEITNNYSIILPLMTVCIISLLLSSKLSPESIYTMKLIRKGINIFQKKSLNFLQDYRVEERMRDDFETVRTDETVNNLIERMLHTERSHFYVIEESGRLHGLLDLDDLGRVLTQHEGLEHVLLAEDLAEESINTLLPDESLAAAMVKFEKSGTSELPVLNNPVEKHMVGVLRYNEMIAIYNRQMMDQDPAANLAERFTNLGPSQRVRLMDDFSLLEWDPPQFMWDQTLVQVDLPGRYGVHIILVKKFSSEENRGNVIPVVPTKDYLISSHDTFVIYGKDQDLERVKHL